MYKSICLFVFCFVTLCAGQLFAQDLKTSVNDNKLLDSLRKREEGEKDSVIFTSKYVRYTTLKLTKIAFRHWDWIPVSMGFITLASLHSPATRPSIRGISDWQQCLCFFNPLKRSVLMQGFTRWIIMP